MWWDEDADVRTRRKRRNKRRRPQAEPILFVKGRKGDKARVWRHRMGTLLVVTLTAVIFMWLCFVGAQALGRVLFTENSQYTINRIACETQPNGKLHERHIREYAGLREGQNLFAVDIDQVRRNLESVPLVRSVKVRRQLPDTLVIDVIERTALARLDDSGRGLPLAVDAEGYVLGPSSYSPSLAVIRGVRQDGLRPGTHLRADAVRDALEVLDICDTTRISQFINIHLIDVGRADYLDVRLTTGERVLLKRENLDWRLRQVAAILQTSDEPGKRIAIIDGTGDDIFPVEYR